MKKYQDAETIRVESKISVFLKAFGVNRLMRRCNFRKRHGAAPFAIFTKIMQLPFTLQSFYHDLIDGDIHGMKKDTLYAFLNNPSYNWRHFLLILSNSIILNLFVPLTSERREKVFVLDSTVYQRACSKLTELLCWVRDHAKEITLKGFTLLTLGWSDGNSFLPLDFVLKSSTEEDKRINGIDPRIRKNTNGYKRRMEALKKAPELAIAMVKRAFQFGISARYVLMDSWFCFPDLILKLKKLRKAFDVICMVKEAKFLRFYYRGRSLSLKELYQAVKKRRGRAIVKASLVLRLASGLRVRVIFCQAKNKKGWVALLTTDLNLPEDEIIRIYGKRWDIEVFFKVIKRHLRLAKEIQSKSYDALVAHTSMVFVRYILLVCQQRQTIDDRTLDGIFRECIQELKDLSLIEAINRLIAYVIAKLRESCVESDEIIEKLIDALMEAAATLFLKGETVKSES